MAFLDMSFLLLFILVVSKTNTQAKLVYQNIEINDDGLNKNDAMDVQDGNQLVRPRRSVVSTTVTDCYRGFFASRQPPSGFRNDHTNIRYICQQVPGNTADYFYSTMFDVNYGIPLYSAYVIRQAQASQFGTAQRVGVDNWRQEDGITKQASDQAYVGQKSSAKGHLLPAETYSFSDAQMLSTFTYTNAVPQIGVFNSGQWAQYEKRIREYATSNCSPQGGDLYLITGISEVSIQSGPSGLEAIQGTLKVLKPSGDAISIPKSMWTAGCCINSSRGALGAFAVIGNNLQDKTKVLMSEVKVTELQGFLLTGVNGFGGVNGFVSSESRML